MYKVVDSERGLDLVSGEYLPGCRWAAAPSFSGCPVDPGNLGKVIFDEERMSLVRARPMGRMGAAGVWAAGSS